MQHVYTVYISYLMFMMRKWMKNLYVLLRTSMICKYYIKQSHGQEANINYMLKPNNNRGGDTSSAKQIHNK